ncbi:hypothetical protein GCM10009636_10620 [Arthrobacter koreensis]|uniref:hypothetical protein n=1 Tax=Arthrobacter koreensis TaxID=199136 RepID=UPI0012646129|nr:hypothetical protein [Arthrobacter koreensis]
MADQHVQEIAGMFVPALADQSQGQAWFADGQTLAAFTVLAAVLSVVTLAFMRRRRTQSVKRGPGVLLMPGSTSANNEWWTRVQWALDATASGNERKYSYGASLLIVLAKSKAAGPREKAVLDAVWKHSKTRMEDPDILHLMEHVSVREVIEGVSTPVPLARTQDMEMLRVLKREILAARLKVVLDEQLGRETSQTVYQLSEMKLPRPLSPPG